MRKIMGYDEKLQNTHQFVIFTLKSHHIRYISHLYILQCKLLKKHVNLFDWNV